MDIITWADEKSSKKTGKERCKKGLGSPDEINYQSTGWPDAYPNEMTPSLYNQFYSPMDELEKQDISSLGVLCMTWNTESVNICGYKEGKWYGGKSPPVYYSPDPCYKSLDLIDKIKALVRSQRGKIDIMVFAFQESAKPGDYFFSWSLPEFLKGEGYVLLKRERAIGAGLTTFTKQKLRGLRTSIFVRQAVYETVPITMTSAGFNACGGEYTKELIRGKGGLQITIDIEGFGKYMFVNYHLPFKASRLNPDNPKRDELLYIQTDCFTNTYTSFIQENNPDYVFVMGDLNYRIQGLSENEMFNRDGSIQSDQFDKWYEDYDELHKLIDRLNYDEGWEIVDPDNEEPDKNHDSKGLKEGVGNKGPGFAPTCKMMKGRETNCTDRMCYQVTHNDGNYRLPSWCDRVLYSHRNLSKPHITPVTYNRVDEGDMMTCSDHAGVYGIFVINK